MTNSVSITADHPAYFVILRTEKDVPLFTRAGYFLQVKEELVHFVEFEGMKILGYVIMPEYVQLLFQLDYGDAEVVLKHLTKRTSARLFDYLENNDDRRRKWLKSFFEQENNDRKTENSIWGEVHFEQVDNERVAASILHDMHHLPVREGITTTPEGYMFSGASSGRLQKHFGIGFPAY
jgi:REP element-mobilizing transposase RayT